MKKKIYIYQRFLQAVMLTCCVLGMTMASNAIAAGVKVKLVTVSGIGVDRDTAVKKALNTAVEQVSGLKIASKNVNAVTNVATTSFGDDAEVVEHNNELSYTQDSSVDTESHGYIRSYQILNEQPVGTDGKNFEVTVEALVSYYDADKSTERKRIAVMMFRNDDEPSKFADKFIKQVNQSLVSYLRGVL